MLRPVTAREDFDRIATMESTVWGGGSWDWLADDLEHDRVGTDVGDVDLACDDLVTEGDDDSDDDDDQHGSKENVRIASFDSGKRPLAGPFPLAGNTGEIR